MSAARTPASRSSSSSRAKPRSKSRTSVRTSKSMSASRSRAGTESKAPTARPASRPVPQRSTPPPIDVSALVSHVSRGSRAASASVTGGHALAGVHGVVVCPPADGFGGRDGVLPPGVAAQLGLFMGMRPLRAVTQAELDAEHARARASAAGAGSAAADGSIRAAVDQYGQLYAQAATRLSTVRRDVDPDTEACGSDDTGSDTGSDTDSDTGSDTASDTGSDTASDDGRPAESGPAAASRVFSGGDGRGRTVDDSGDTLDGFYDELARRPPCSDLLEGAPRRGVRDVRSGFDAAEGGSGDTASNSVNAWASHGPDASAPDGPGRYADELAELRRTCAALAGRLAALGRIPDTDRQSATPDTPATSVTSVKSAESAPTSSDRPLVVAADVRLDGEPVRLKVGGIARAGGVWECRLEGSVTVAGGVCVLVVVDPAYADRLASRVVPGRIAVLGPSGRVDGVFAGDAFRIMAGPDDPGVLVVWFAVDA